MSSVEPVGDDGTRLLYSLSKEELVKIIVDDAKNWLAHDGVWFQAVEKRYGLEAAVEVDTEAWRDFSAIEAKRILERLGMKPGGGHTGAGRVPETSPLRPAEFAGCR